MFNSELLIKKKKLFPQGHWQINKHPSLSLFYFLQLIIVICQLQVILIGITFLIENILQLYQSFKAFSWQK